MITVSIIPVLKDNYSYILQSGKEIGVVDPGEAGPVIEFCEEHAIKPTIIFNTHHHGDHIAGNNEIKARYGCKLAGPATEKNRIGHMDIFLDEDMPQNFGGENLKILATPGHTSGGICLYFPQSKIIFTGDTLFSMGCGRLFEGTAAQMWDSLQKIMALPDETQIYCGHEYTLSNAGFCQEIEPNNPQLTKRIDEVKALRENGQPTLPVSLKTEKETNVFLRAGSAVRFAELRKLKDEF